MKKYIERDYFTEEEYDNFCKDLIIFPFSPMPGKTYYKIHHKILDKDVVDKMHNRIAKSDAEKISFIKDRMYQEKRKTNEYLEY